ncbi:MAG: alpha/beta fold hydrolase [Dehalococcoidia bacterium]
MATFVLVHGGWHGAWCWQRVTPLLRQAGHTVIAPDLPGHGADTTPLSAHPWEQYVPRIGAILAAQQEPVILLGHSSGGMIISAAAALHPRSVGALVYLAAFLLPPGITPPAIMRDDLESLLPAALTVDAVAGTVTVNPDAAGAVFYADCSAADAAWATSMLVPEPLPPPGGAVDLSPPPVPQRPLRVYIETLNDRALGPATQRRMYTALPCDAVYSLSTSHSPFLSAPRQLADCLLQVVSLLPPDGGGYTS